MIIFFLSSNFATMLLCPLQKLILLPDHHIATCVQTSGTVLKEVRHTVLCYYCLASHGCLALPAFWAYFVFFSGDNARITALLSGGHSVALNTRGNREREWIMATWRGRGEERRREKEGGGEGTDKSRGSKDKPTFPPFVSHRCVGSCSFTLCQSSWSG